MTGLLDYSEIVFALGQLGSEVIDLLGNLTENMINSIGNIGFNFSISYELETFGTDLDMIAEIERNGIPITTSSTTTKIEDMYASATDEELGDTLGWTHGITMKQDIYKGREILRGHLYLQGMPRSASLSTQFTENRTIVEFDFKEYSPKYDWLLLDLKGIQNRDVNVFFEKIPTNIDFSASADLTTNLEIGGEMHGDVEILVCDSGEDFCSQEIGALYLMMHTYEPIQSIREFFISELPSKLDLNFDIQKEMRFYYDASSEVEYIYSKLSKILTDSWHHVNLILHDIPPAFEFDFTANTDFDIDDPLPLQGLPKLDIDTKRTHTLDIIASVDGAAVGQRGKTELFIQDVQDTRGRLKGNSYDIESLGVDFLRLKISNLPLLDNYQLNSLVLEAEDLRSLVFKVNLLFGVFPYFDLGSNIRGNIEITLDHTLNLFGSDMHAQVALVDVVYEGIGGARIPVATPIFINSVSSDLRNNQRHVVIPAVLVSLLITWANNI
jgi:hypothetical protein